MQGRMSDENKAMSPRDSSHVREPLCLPCSINISKICDNDEICLSFDCFEDDVFSCLPFFFSYRLSSIRELSSAPSFRSLIDSHFQYSSTRKQLYTTQFYYQVSTNTLAIGPNCLIFGLHPRWPALPTNSHLSNPRISELLPVRFRPQAL